MTLKRALTIHDQIELLRQRGMTIDDEKKVSTFLQSNNYYRLNIYFHKLMDSPNHYHSNIKFSQIVALYENDRWLRNKILTLLEPIEIRTRTQVSHHLALTYGSNAFYQEKNFKDHKKYREIFNNFTNELSRNTKDPVIVHHKKKYAGLFPIWVAIEFFSFNTLSKFYKILLEEDKKMIAKGFCNINDYLLGQWLHVLSIQRNICAHYGYLYRREFPIRPIIAKSFNWDQKQDNKLFAIFLVLRRLSDRKLWNPFIQNISEGEKSRFFFDLGDYGFPIDWKSYLT